MFARSTVLVMAAALCAACGPKAHNGSIVTTPPLPNANDQATVATEGAAGLDGTRVTVGCRQMYVRCTGAGAGPTVVLDADWNQTSTAWDAVQNALSAEARVCSYDRAGLGHSDVDDVGPRSAQLMVYDLVELLAAAGEVGPFVLVADGYAGATARLFAAQHPTSVAAVVLLGPERRHRLGAGEAIDIDRSDAQADAAVIAKTIDIVVVADGDDTGPALKEKPAEVIETIRRLVRAGLGGESAAR